MWTAGGTRGFGSETPKQMWCKISAFFLTKVLKAVIVSMSQKVLGQYDNIATNTFSTVE